MEEEDSYIPPPPSREPPPFRPNFWKVCFAHGDQTKYYRKLYGRRSQVKTLREFGQETSSDQMEQDHM